MKSLFYVAFLFDDCRSQLFVTQECIVFFYSKILLFWKHGANLFFLLIEENVKIFQSLLVSYLWIRLNLGFNNFYSLGFRIVLSNLNFCTVNCVGFKFWIFFCFCDDFYLCIVMHWIIRDPLVIQVSPTFCILCK